MLTQTANRDPRLALWLRVREYAVPASMIETATARRHVGDWAAACAAAGIDVDFNLRSLARSHGRDLADRIRADLRHLAPDLLRWHMPRIAPDGLLRPDLTVTLARYDTAGSADAAPPVHLVARTPPAWADGGQRISLALWDGSRSGTGVAAGDPRPGSRPDRRFRLDLHRHLWDARRTDELRVRSGADRPASEGPPGPEPGPELTRTLPPEHRCAVDRWAAEAAIVLRAEGRTTGSVTVRLGARRRLVLDLVADGDGDGDGQGAGTPSLRIGAAPTDGSAHALPVLPDAAAWVLPDLDLLRTGSIGADRLHPLVAAALAPGRAPAAPARPSRTAGPGPGQPRLVECRGARHRIGLVDGVLTALDHDPVEVRSEELLAGLSGTPLPCFRAIDAAHRRPDCLTGVRERLDHGDVAGALAVVEGLLGPDATLRPGPLLDELEAAARRRITYGLFRAGLAGPGPNRLPPKPSRSRHDRRAAA
ncbi:hypothetical protein [Streptomyces sp. IGB124]|uniref:hypothetical protein n=1 Tax=Streptomyces sp. IGB124 TaxID=1519485 RepID=UPI0006AF2D3E|nr:hypothetical protein [Streptomyces sp. IGB124]KOU65340.1 hypothetical protein ADK96_17500 [Streptomyces sp. IGB124]